MLVKRAVIFSYFSVGCLIIESGAYVLGVQLHKFSHLRMTQYYMFFKLAGSQLLL